MENSSFNWWEFKRLRKRGMSGCELSKAPLAFYILLRNVPRPFTWQNTHFQKSDNLTLTPTPKNEKKRGKMVMDAPYRLHSALKLLLEVWLVSVCEAETVNTKVSVITLEDDLHTAHNTSPAASEVFLHRMSAFRPSLLYITTRAANNCSASQFICWFISRVVWLIKCWKSVKMVNN